MASFTELKAYIQSYIYQNSAGDISGQDLQGVLIEMVEKMGDDAINAIAAAVADEITARQNAVQGEADARSQADLQLGQRITNEIRAEAQRAEAAFDNLELEDTAGAGAQPTQINLTLRKNDGTEEDPDWRTLTQLILASATTSKAGLMSAADKSSLDYILDQFAFVGVASTSTNPGTPQEKVFYLTAEKGTFTNFLDGSSHALSFATAGLRVLYYVPNSGWQYSNIILIEDKPNANSSSLVKSGGVDAAIRSMVGYLVCTTAGATAAKTITGSFYILQQGGSLKVKFTYKNTADDATLKIGDAEAQPLYYAGRRAGSSNSWEAGEVVEIFYDGTNYYANNVMGGGAGDGAFDISVYNSVEGTPAQYASLSAALGTNGANVPQSLRKGGMSVKYVQSTDNKYVQYRLLSDEWSADTNDWAIAEEGVYVENSEFIYVKTDAESKILLAIKADGGIYYGAGVPQQVIDYIQQKIDELSLDEYEDIVAFLNGLEEGDKTLQQLLNEKLDAEGLDSDALSTMEVVDNPEWIDIKIDSEEKLLEGIKQDATKVITGNTQIGGNVNVAGSIETSKSVNANSVSAESLISLSGIITFTVNNPEWNAVLLDSDEKILAGIRKNGTFFMGVAPDVLFSTGENIENVGISGELSDTEDLITGAGILSYITENLQKKYDYESNYPIIPNEIYVLDNQPTLLYKDSMVLDPCSSSDLNMVLTTMKNGYHKSFNVQNPLNIEESKVGNSARVTLEQKKHLWRNIYKDIRIHKGTVASKSGKTPKILMIGDSLTHGDNGAQSSPIVKVNELLPSRYNVTPTMIGTFGPFGVLGEGRGTFSFEAMAGTNSGLSNFEFPSYGGTLENSQTKTTPSKNYNPFTFPATAEDLSNHPQWCFTNKWNYPAEPDSLCYADATAEEKANYHFFIVDFDRYVHIWDDENHIPDIITIALGTNDWWRVGQIDMGKTLAAIDIIYARAREALPNTKIAFVTSQCIAMPFQTDEQGNWVTEISPLLLNLQKRIADWNTGGDDNVFEIPLYACGSRWLAFDGHTAWPSSDISESNNTQWQLIDSNVHLLDGVDSDGYWEYMEALITSIVCLIN